MAPKSTLAGRRSLGIEAPRLPHNPRTHPVRARHSRGDSAAHWISENNARQGFVTGPQFEAVAAALPEHLRDAARFGYITGWRRGEITTLEWSDVDLAAGTITLRREHSKNGQPRTVPFRVTAGEGGATIFAALGEIIARRVKTRTETGDGARLVFHRDGHALVDFRKSWEAACKTAGRPGLLFHDLRRSAVRNFSAAGVPDWAAMRVTGHRTRSVYDRYNIVSDDDVRSALERTQAPGVTTKEGSAQESETA